MKHIWTDHAAPKAHRRQQARHRTPCRRPAGAADVEGPARHDALRHRRRPQRQRLRRLRGMPVAGRRSRCSGWCSSSSNATARDADALPGTLQQGRVLSAVYRVSPPSASQPQGLALRLMVDPRRRAVEQRAPLRKESDARRISASNSELNSCSFSSTWPTLASSDRTVRRPRTPARPTRSCGAAARGGSRR